MSGSVGASLISRNSSRKFLVSVLATGFFLGVSLGVAGVVGAQQTETMNASWYGPGFEGRTTANGEIFDPSGFTAAHKTLPFGTTMEVCYEGCVNVRINDRGPFIAGRDLDLSQGAAEAIGLTAVGHATVSVTYTDGSAPAGPSSGGTAPTASRPEQPAVQPEQPAVQPTVQPEAESQPTVQPGVELVAEPRRSQASDISQAEIAVDDQYAVEDQYDDSAVERQYDDDSTDDSAAVNQYSPDDEGQYSRPKLADAAPETAALAPLPPPKPSQVEVAPLELAAPGSTVERRIQLAVADPPESYTGPVPEDPPAETDPIEAAPEKAAPEKAAPEKAAPEKAAPSDSAGQEKAPVEAPAETPVDDPDTDEVDDLDAEEEQPESGSIADAADLTVLPDTGGLPLMPLAGAALILSLMFAGVRVFRR